MGVPTHKEVISALFHANYDVFQAYTSAVDGNYYISKGRVDEALRKLKTAKKFLDKLQFKKPDANNPYNPKTL